MVHHYLEDTCDRKRPRPIETQNGIDTANPEQSPPTISHGQSAALQHGADYSAYLRNKLFQGWHIKQDEVGLILYFRVYRVARLAFGWEYMPNPIDPQHFTNLPVLNVEPVLQEYHGSAFSTHMRTYFLDDSTWANSVYDMLVDAGFTPSGSEAEQAQILTLLQTALATHGTSVFAQVRTKSPCRPWVRDIALFRQRDHVPENAEDDDAGCPSYAFAPTCTSPDAPIQPGVRWYGQKSGFVQEGGTSPFPRTDALAFS
tara:strand:- start:19 stop:792 length:774 start_codon:yes stop_codon:yes gene_type:complete